MFNSRTGTRVAWLFIALAFGLICMEPPAGAQSPNSRLQDGHLMRRIGFGPTPAELELIGRIGNYRYLAQQLAPDTIDDGDMLARLAQLKPEAGDEMGYVFYPQRWYFRMIHSKRQLLEKTTLLWHEHFATSVDKAGMVPRMLGQQEELLRRNALGSFRRMLIEITTDPAMLVWLDNNENNGRGAKPPNENYARELLQLFALGTDQLNEDGSVKRDAQGNPLPAYSERDIRELARTLTGWRVVYDEKENRFQSVFDPNLHDGGDKQVLGRRIAGRPGAEGAREVEDAVDVLMAQPAMAPFLARILIWKFATETPSPRYVARVARTFAATGGDLRATMFSLLTDREFWRAGVMRSQPKTPIEHLAGVLRALEAHSQGKIMVEFGFATRHLVFYPPTVFSFYPPGEKRRLLQTDLALMRDNFALVLLFTEPGNESWVDVPALLRKYQIQGTPAQIVDQLSDLLMQAPPEARARARIIQLISDLGETETDTLRIATWLLLSTPDYQRN
jgi:Protein of unknown function (DUF1800)